MNKKNKSKTKAIVPKKPFKPNILDSIPVESVNSYLTNPRFSYAYLNPPETVGVTYHNTVERNQFDFTLNRDCPTIDLTNYREYVYVYSGFALCIRQDHEIKDYLARIHDLFTNQLFEANVFWCDKCKRYYISAEQIKVLLKRNVILNIRLFSWESNYDGFRAQSELAFYGYRVGKSGLTQKRRQELLQKIVEEELMSIGQIIAHLSGLIKLHNGNISKQYAVDDWEADLHFVSQMRYTNPQVSLIYQDETMESNSVEIKNEIVNEPQISYKKETQNAHRLIDYEYTTNLIINQKNSYNVQLDPNISLPVLLKKYMEGPKRFLVCKKHIRFIKNKGVSASLIIQPHPSKVDKIDQLPTMMELQTAYNSTYQFRRYWSLKPLMDCLERMDDESLKYKQVVSINPPVVLNGNLTSLLKIVAIQVE